MIEVRPARPGDGPILLEMTRSLAAAHDALDHFTANAAGFEKALFRENPIIFALIACVDGVPAGSAVWHRSFSTNRGEEVMYLEDVSVLEAFRRRGVARALFKSVAREAMARGYSKIFWLVMNWNEGAQKLYRDLGAELEEGFQVCNITDEKLRDLAK